jgi:transcriptional regulator with XRE-family HTH domain
MPTPHRPSASVTRTLRKLGLDLKEARLRRRLPMSLVAGRAFTSRATLQRTEAGDAGVGAGIYAAVLQALGLLENLGQVADPLRDAVGQAAASRELPQRARQHKARLEPGDG